MILPLLPLDEIPIPFFEPEMFGDISCIGLPQLNVDERLLASLFEQPVIVGYVEPALVLNVGVLLRVLARTR